MVARTPSPLRWLVDQRLRLEGEFERLSKLKTEVDVLHSNVSSLIAAVQTTMSLHEIPIDLEGVQSVTSSQDFKRGDPGSFKRLVVRAMKEGKGVPLTTKQVAALVRSFWPDAWGACQAEQDLHNNVRYALKSMRKRGEAFSPVYGRAGKEATWVLRVGPAKLSK